MILILSEFATSILWKISYEKLYDGFNCISIPFNDFLVCQNNKKRRKNTQNWKNVKLQTIRTNYADASVQLYTVQQQAVHLAR